MRAPYLSKLGPHGPPFPTSITLFFWGLNRFNLSVRESLIGTIGSGLCRDKPPTLPPLFGWLVGHFFSPTRAGDLRRAFTWRFSCFSMQNGLDCRHIPELEPNLSCYQYLARHGDVNTLMHERCGVKWGLLGGGGGGGGVGV